MEPKTTPPYYDRPLTDEAATERLIVEQEKRKLEEKFDQESDPINRLKLQKQIDIYEYRLDWQGANPRGLDKQELKTVNTAPRHEDPTSDKFRASVKSPKSALRAYCVSECMAGQPGLVRECMSLECPLWPFRMGKDPFRGMELPKVDEVIAEGDVLEDEFDDFEDDEDDEDEGDD